MSRPTDDPIFDNGYDAYHNGVRRADCPYDEDDPASGDLYDRWTAGWDQADSDSDDEIE